MAPTTAPLRLAPSARRTPDRWPTPAGTCGAKVVHAIAGSLLLSTVDFGGAAVVPVWVCVTVPRPDRDKR